MTHRGPTRAENKVWGCSLNFGGYQMERRGLGKEGEMAVSHRMFFLDGSWGTFHPCLFPREQGSGGSLVFLPEDLVSLLMPAIHTLLSCDLGSFWLPRGYSL